ncbi:MAG TPA: hypothetical protein PLJ21_00870 [Pseudobdellovibrionaceae bacterium]|nr:hypothetical protein [Pseudobdellovibrionaceae bacterium]
MKILNFFNRRTVVIDPKLQFGIVSFFVGLSLINIIFFYVAIQLSKNKIIETILSLDPDAQNIMMNSFITQSDILIYSIKMFSVFSLLLAVIMGVVLLNHVAGPAYAIKKFLEELLRGDMTRVPLKFRKYDFFTDISDLLNQLAIKYIIKKPSEENPKQ